jgi:RNA polymerase primary sigma factor
MKQEMITLIDEQSDPSEAANSSMVKERLAEILVKLTTRERRVLEYRFGFIDGLIKNYTEIGKMFNVCGNRIRCNEAIALRKLRTNHAKDIRELYFSLQ